MKRKKMKKVSLCLAGMMMLSSCFPMSIQATEGEEQKTAVQQESNPRLLQAEHLIAHYDMSVKDGKLKDVSGNGKDAALHDLTEEDVASYNGEAVLQFDANGYADLPEGVVGQSGEFTVQTTFSTQTTANHWLWCFGRTIDSWPNVDHYIFVSPMSAQGSYRGSVLAAISVDGETRMSRPNTDLSAGYTTVTMVSDGSRLFLYMDGELVSELEHGKNVLDAVPAQGESGFLGKSLYHGDALLKANVSDMKLWNTALNEEQVKAAAPTAEEKTDMLLADIQKSMLNGNPSLSLIETDLAFPDSVDGCPLKWTIPENSVIAQDGKVTAGSKETEVTVNVEYGQGKETQFQLIVPGEDIDKILDTAAAQVDIPNKDDVRGNITLPNETNNGVKITWKTSHPEIVDVNAQPENVNGYGEVPAGVVTRPNKDQEVTMTAELTYKGETRTKEITLQVKAAPKAVQESDYTDYFFAYFAGERYQDGEQIYFASSQDGMNWEDLNNNEPVLTSSLGEKGVRDPFLIRSAEGDKFYLIATDLKINGGNGWDAAQNQGSQSLMVWESTDLVNWSEQRMVEVSASIGAGCTWAPEAIYDAATGEYVVYWASRTPDIDQKQRVYYAKTRDFYTFTEPQIFVEKDESSIDTTIIEDNGMYYRYTKNEGGATNELGAKTKTIFLEKSSQVLGSYTHVGSDSLNSNQYVEGPTIFKLNEDDATDTAKWCLLVDDFGGVGYYPLLASDLSTGEFTKLEAGSYLMPSRARHGTPIRITTEEYNRIQSAYGTPEEVQIATVAGQTPKLPETILWGAEETKVTWNLEGISFDKEPYSIVEVQGTTEESRARVIANVQIIPANVEYMIDCNNANSMTWENTMSVSADLKNKEAADQKKTADNDWGYVSTVGTTDKEDMTGYSQNDTLDPYKGGYWARGGKDIAYAVTLSEGRHDILLGCTGWWNLDRQMDVYYSVNGGQEEKLCDFDAVKSQGTYAKGSIELDQEALVTITVKKAANADPILSWITVCGEQTKAQEIDYTALQEQIDDANKLHADDYTVESYERMLKALHAAEALLNQAESQEEVEHAYQALADAIQGLILKDTQTPPEEPDADDTNDNVNNDQNYDQNNAQNNDADNDKNHDQYSGTTGTDQADKNKGNTSSSVQTGDRASVILYAVIAAVGLAAIVGTLTVRRKYKK